MSKMIRNINFKLMPVDLVDIKRRAIWGPILESFFEQESNCCLVEVDGYDSATIAPRIQGLILQRNLREKVKCTQNGGKVYLIKLLESE